MNGIFLFIRAGRAGAAEETLLDQAIDELKSTHALPDEELYQDEIQLALAAAYLKKSQIISLRASTEQNPERKARLSVIAARHEKNAKGAIKKFRDKFKWNEDDAKRALPFLDSVDAEYFANAIADLWKL
jgi:hypothetical protein